MADEKAFRSDLTINQACTLLESLSEECINPAELLERLTAAAKNKRQLVAYDGFEPSGKMHIAQGLVKAVNVNKMIRCGIKVVILIADEFALLNGKLGGDLGKIREAGNNFATVWGACGMNVDEVEFRHASDLQDEKGYSRMQNRVAVFASVARIKRCIGVMGRSEDAFLAQPAAQILYPVQQCADIFHLGVDICQLGMDQRKVNVLAREFASAHADPRPPIILSHRMISGLGKADKMSKSTPGGAIFMEDDPDDVREKIANAWEPWGDSEVVTKKGVFTNSVWEIVKHIVFPCLADDRVNRDHKKTFAVQRPARDGGDISFDTFEEFDAAFRARQLHPTVLDVAVAREINYFL